MITYTNALTLYQKLTEDDSSTNTALFNIVLNEKIRHVLSRRQWPFLEKSTTLLTVADQQFYKLPALYKKLIDITVLVGGTLYVPKEAPNRVFWDNLNDSTTTADFPDYYFIFGNQIGLWQIPATASNTITINYRQRQKDISIADYTTGTIVSIANGATTVTGSGTTWTNKMTGRWIRITDSDTANTGDGEWYEIASVTSTTVLELVAPYEGTAIAAGSASYKIGQVSLIPEDYQMIPIYLAVADYWLKEDDNKNQIFEQKAEILLERMIEEFSSKSENPVIDDGVDDVKFNPNLFVTK